MPRTGRTATVRPGPVAQLVERLLCKQGVPGSIPGWSTKRAWRNWQTRRVKDPVPTSECRFESCRPHTAGPPAPASPAVLPPLPMTSSQPVPAHLLRGLHEALSTAGIVDNPRFELLAPRAVNWALADRRAGLVARVREVGGSAFPLEALNENLVRCRDIADAGAPVVPPLLAEALTFGADTHYSATLWPLGNNRPVTPDEMAAVLRDIHDVTPLPSGLKEWLEVRHGGSENDVDRLRNKRPSLPAEAIEECAALMDSAKRRLRILLADAPRTLLHGDAHPLNIIELDGRMVSCDLDEICVGPPEADLSLPIVHSQRYPGFDPTVGERLVRAYGRSVNRELLDAIVHARAISKAISLGQRWRGDEWEGGSVESFLQRLEALKSPNQRFARLHGEECPSPFAD